MKHRQQLLMLMFQQIYLYYKQKNDAFRTFSSLYNLHFLRYNVSEAESSFLFINVALYWKIFIESEASLWCI